MRRAAAVVLGLLLLLGVGVAGGLAVLGRAMDAPGPHADTVRVHVAPGTSVRGILAQIAARGALESPRAVEAYLRLHAASLAPKAGNYDLPARATPREILALLQAGRVVLEQVTIVEGWTFAEMRRALESHRLIRNTLRGKSPAEVMVAIGAPGQHPEGRFFPDTYRFADGTTDVEILRLAYSQMASELAAAWGARAPDLPLASPDEALILASIVEKETGLASERPAIAGVFATRLRKGMRLQTDPTVIYGLGASFDGDLRRRDLERDTPYNTYTREGLPPTPIALPGRDALLAAVRPDETGALYFVATGTGDGSHAFSRTLAEHNAAVARYLARLREARNPPK
jgi:UPF0755 protein